MLRPQGVSAPVITKRIKQTQTWQELEEVIDEHSANLNHIHISAAILHLARLAVTRDQETRASSHPQQSYNRGSEDGSAPSTSYPQLPSEHQRKHRREAQTQRLRGQRPGQPAAQPPIPDPAPTLEDVVSPTLSSTSVLLPAGTHQLLRRLLTLAQQRMEIFDVQGISNIIYALALFQHHDMMLLEGLLAAVQYRLDTGTPQNLANIMWGAINLGYTPDRDWISLYYGALDVQVVNFGPQDISNTLWAFGNMQIKGTQYKVSPDVINKLLQQAFPQLHGFRPQHLANTVWGLARLGFCPSPAWLQQFFAASSAKMDQMNASELSSLAWAVHRLRVVPEDTWTARLLQVSERMIPNMAPDHISQLALALGGLRARPSQLWVGLLLSCTKQRLGQFHTQGLANILLGLSRMAGTSSSSGSSREGASASGAGDSSTSTSTQCLVSSNQEWDSWWSSFLAAAEPSRLASLSACSLELCNMLHAVASMQLRPPAAWVHGLVDALGQAPMMSSLASDPRQAAMTMVALDHLGVVPSEQWRHSLVAASMPALVHKYNARELAVLLKGIAKWGDVPPATWMARFWWRSFRLLRRGQVGPWELVTTLNALRSLSQEPNAPWLSAFLVAARYQLPLFSHDNYPALCWELAQQKVVQPDSEWCDAVLLGMYRVWDDVEPRQWPDLMWAMAEFKVSHLLLSAWWLGDAPCQRQGGAGGHEGCSFGSVHGVDALVVAL